MHYIGKLDINKIGEYGKKISTDDVVLTNERELHIYEDHLKDYEVIINNIDRVVLNPKEILIDNKNENTLFFIDKLGKKQFKCYCKIKYN